MKTNGIIRKVDGLGRVVIPREYRKLHRISLGDPMEISCLDSGEIVLKKMDMTLALEDLSGEALRVLSECISGTVLVSSLDKWLGGTGADKGMFIGKDVPQAIRSKLMRREDYSIIDVNEIGDSALKCEKRMALVAEPIAGDGDVFGAFYVTGSDAVSERDISLIRVAAVILGNSLQKF